VIPVSEFGLPVDSEGWDVFQDRTGLAVVLDLAAAFDGTRPARVPSVISLHATKTVTAGEGGFILSTDDDLIEAIRQCANFGFSKSNQATGPGLNAKLSEYAAAVALVSLSDWPDNRKALQAVGQQYRDVLQGIGCVSLPDGWPAEWVSSTFNVRLEADILPAVVRNLESIGVASRSWWGPGLHRQEAFAHFERTETPITDDLAAITLGLPFWIGLPVEAPGAIAQVIANTQRAFLSR
jgi:dTDP-4-amino-4,6-dideoxygalactose transaminase